jgi:DNA-binding transcriptional LysR family regulator
MTSDPGRRSSRRSHASAEAARLAQAGGGIARGPRASDVGDHGPAIALASFDRPLTPPALYAFTPKKYRTPLSSTW